MKFSNQTDHGGNSKMKFSNQTDQLPGELDSVIFRSLHTLETTEVQSH